MKKICVLLMICSLLVVGCGNQVINRGDKVSSKEIKIGAILPLTGDLAKYGEGVGNSIKLAIQELDKQKKIELIIEDDVSCQEKEAITAVQKLINLDQVDIVIGPLCSSATLAIIPVMEKNKIVLITPSATTPKLTENGEYIFRTCSSDKAKSEETAKFVFNNLGYTKVALLHDIANDSFIQQRDDFNKVFQGLGGQVIMKESFKTGDADFKSQLLKIKDSLSQAVVFASWLKESGLILKQAKESGINLPFISSDDLIGDDEIIKIAGQAADGVICAVPIEPENQEHVNFIDLYKDYFAQEPTVYTAEAYDASILAIKAVQASDGSREDIKDKLYEVSKGYIGASGNCEFDENGDVHKGVVFKVIKDGEFVEYGE